MKFLIIRLLRGLFQLLPPPSGPRMGQFRTRLELAYLRRTDMVQYRVEKAREMGAAVGKDCRFFSLNIFSEPGLVEIGDGVIISGEVVLLTHDGAVHTLREQVPGIVGHYGRISIGDNTFVGFGAIILPDVSIGKNCIVAAGAVVMESFPDDCVIAGNPAKVMFRSGVYLAMKRRSPRTIIDEDHTYPNTYPRDALYDRINALPIRAPRTRQRGGPRPSGSPTNRDESEQ